jgi:hypothetical protein
MKRVNGGKKKGRKGEEGKGYEESQGGEGVTGEREEWKE